MKRKKLISFLSLIVGIIMISIGLMLQNEDNYYKLNIATNDQYDIKNIAASTNMFVKQMRIADQKETPVLAEVQMETAPASVIVPPRIEVYEGMTLEELAEKIDRNLGTDIVYGKGMLIASESINRGVDPYVATAILLHETGCKAKCSNLARYCNNFGGQKGSPSCNGGSFKRYNTMDEGIVGYISNLQRNYYAIGLNTVELIAPKYCEGNEWAGMINWYIRKIREN